MKEIVLIAIAPCVIVFLVLGWMWLISKRSKDSSINLSGLGLKIEIKTTR